MKSILLAVGILVSQVGLSFGSGSFEGGGHWKDPEGGKGTWTEKTEIKKAEGGFEITSNLKVLKAEEVVFEESTTINIAVKEHGFFDVLKGEAVVGNGYCYGKVCHYDYTDGTESGEETFHASRRKLHKIGSAKGEHEGHKWSVAWHGTLKERREKAE